jgi:SAM-dependent methyltransferase
MMGTPQRTLGGHDQTLTTGKFRAITETARTRADADQIAMARLRHSLVAVLAKGRDLLDVACGTGYALPLIAASARSVTACDREPVNIRDARSTGTSATLHVLDAEHLPFPDESFDVIACLEAIYYFQDWRAFVRRAGNLLRADGAILITWPNPLRPAFSRSPFSTAYPDVADMRAVAEDAGLDGTCYGAFPLGRLAMARRPWLDGLRRLAVKHHLMPSSLRARMLVKRVLYRRLRPLGEISLMHAPFEHLTRLGSTAGADFAMLYFIGRKGPGEGR